MQALDGFVTRARSQNDDYHNLNLQTLTEFATKIRGAHGDIDGHLEHLESCANDFLTEISVEHDDMGNLVSGLAEEVRQSLSELQNCVRDTEMAEYSPTGSTPEKVQYDFSITLPQTEPHDRLIRRLRRVRSPVKSPMKSPMKSPFKRAPVQLEPFSSPLGPRPSSPSKGLVYHDKDGLVESPSKPSRLPSGLRELDVNISRLPNSSTTSEGTCVAADENIGIGGDNGDLLLCSKDDGTMLPPPSKRRMSANLAAKTNLTGESQKMMIPKRVTRRNATAPAAAAEAFEDRENLLPGSGLAPTRRVRSGVQ